MDKPIISGMGNTIWDFFNNSCFKNCKSTASLRDLLMPAGWQSLVYVYELISYCMTLIYALL